MKPPYATGSVPGLSGHTIAYRWRSLPRVRRHRPSKPQGSSERALPWQVTIDQLICASLGHVRYRYNIVEPMVGVENVAPASSALGTSQVGPGKLQIMKLEEYSRSSSNSISTIGNREVGLMCSKDTPLKF